MRTRRNAGGAQPCRADHPGNEGGLRRARRRRGSEPVLPPSRASGDYAALSRVGPVIQRALSIRAERASNWSSRLSIGYEYQSWGGQSLFILLVQPRMLALWPSKRPSIAVTRASVPILLTFPHDNFEGNMGSMAEYEVYEPPCGQVTHRLADKTPTMLAQRRRRVAQALRTRRRRPCFARNPRALLAQTWQTCQSWEVIERAVIGGSGFGGRTDPIVGGGLRSPTRSTRRRPEPARTAGRSPAGAGPDSGPARIRCRRP